MIRIFFYFDYVYLKFNIRSKKELYQLGSTWSN